jgi:hypothetical protein
VAELSSVLEVKGGVANERLTLGGSTEKRSVDVPASHVRSVPTGLVRVYVGATRLLRVLVRTLYMFPILLVTKVALHLMHAPGGDYITVGFVVLVIALFGVFAAVMMLLALVGSRSQRQAGMTTAFRPPSRREIDGLIARTLPKAAVTVTGRVDAGLEPGATVLEERWGNNAGTLVRFVEGGSFAVLPDGGEPIIVDLTACPLVLAQYEHEREPFAVPGIGAVTPLGRYVLRQGETVEVIASHGKPAAHPLLLNTAAATPYRESEGAMTTVVTSTPAHPVVIRSLGI